MLQMNPHYETQLKKKIVLLPHFDNGRPPPPQKKSLAEEYAGFKVRISVLGNNYAKDVRRRSQAR